MDINKQLDGTKGCDPINHFKSMMESCYCYGGLTKKNKYILEYKEELGEELWSKTYDEYSKFLKDNYTVEHNIGTDSEGLSYNRLIPRYYKPNENI